MVPLSSRGSQSLARWTRLGPAGSLRCALMSDDVEPTTVAGHAEQAAAHVRAINHLTLPGAALPEVDDLYAALGWLETICERLPQALEQLGGVTATWRGAGRLRVDGTSRGLDLEVAAIDRALAAATANIRAAARALHDAHEAASHLIVTDPHEELFRVEEPPD